jgi:hypothetical protein
VRQDVQRTCTAVEMDLRVVVKTLVLAWPANVVVRTLVSVWLAFVGVKTLVSSCLECIVVNNFGFSMVGMCRDEWWACVAVV